MLLQQEVGYLQDGYTLLQCCSASLVLESTSPILHLEVPETMPIISNFYINHDECRGETKWKGILICWAIVWASYWSVYRLMGMSEWTYLKTVYNNCRQLIVCIYWKVCQVNKTKAMQKEKRKGKHKPLSVRRGSANQHHLEQPPCLVDPSHIVPGYCLHLSWISLQPNRTREKKSELSVLPLWFQNFRICYLKTPKWI